MLKEISGSTTMEPSVSTPSTLNTCKLTFQKHFGREIPTSYSGSVALVASAFHPLKTSSSTGDLGIQTIVSDCLGFLLKHYLFILRSSLTLTGPSGPSASADGLGGGESLRQAPFLMAVSLLMGAVMFSSSSSGLPIFP